MMSIQNVGEGWVLLHEDCFLSVSGIFWKSGIAAILFGWKEKIFWDIHCLKKRATTRVCPYNQIVLQVIYNRQIYAEISSPSRIMTFPGSCCTCFYNLCLVVIFGSFHPGYLFVYEKIIHYPAVWVCGCRGVSWSAGSAWRSSPIFRAAWLMLPLQMGWMLIALTLDRIFT